VDYPAQRSFRNATRGGGQRTLFQNRTRSGRVGPFTRSVAAATHPDKLQLSAKLSLSILLVTFCAQVGPITAQVATDPDLQSSRSEPAPVPTATAEPSIPERSQIDEIFKQTSLGKDADESRLHLEWRQLQNQVVNEPDIVAAKRAAETTRTDLEKRQRLRDYYDLYYGRMRVLARSAEMKTALDQLKVAHLSQLTQARVRHETDSGLPTPSPTPKKKQKASHARKFQGEG
jgi:hypothetical protein